MKNLLIYLSSQKKFDEEDEILARIQIDNSLNLGWKKNEILLVTNFNFFYNGISPIKINEKIYYEFDRKANKVPAILFLLKKKIISDSEIYWCHDLDAYELNKIEENKLGLQNTDLGLTHYIYKPEWQFGSIFFKRSAEDVFEVLDRETRIAPHPSRNNEKVITKLINSGVIKPQRYQKLNPTYNLMKKYLKTIYPLANKPIKVLHFRPSDIDPQLPHPTLEIFMYGKNYLGKPLMDKRLIAIFKHHGIY